MIILWICCWCVNYVFHLFLCWRIATQGSKFVYSLQVWRIFEVFCGIRKRIRRNEDVLFVSDVCFNVLQIFLFFVFFAHREKFFCVLISIVFLISVRESFWPFFVNLHKLTHLETFYFKNELFFNETHAIGLHVVKLPKQAS